MNLKLNRFKYLTLPIFFIFGATLEYTMIHWRPNGVNFYDVWIRKYVHTTVDERERIFHERKLLFTSDK
ncbi:hypothetical protein SNEBB_007769 [Seison nebaliae]|nr:hypothetical protein SNEBB_007769 [Seison nebaliae]